LTEIRCRDVVRSYASENLGGFTRLFKTVCGTGLLQVKLCTPISRCCDPRLRYRWQRDRDARTHGRVQRVVSSLFSCRASIPSSVSGLDGIIPYYISLSLIRRVGLPW